MQFTVLIRNINETKRERVSSQYTSTMKGAKAKPFPWKNNFPSLCHLSLGFPLTHAEKDPSDRPNERAAIPSSHQSAENRRGVVFQLHKGRAK